MKLVVLGVDAEGRSTVLSEEPFQAGESKPLWSTDKIPPDLSYERNATVDVEEIDLGATAGTGEFLYGEFEANQKRPIHRSFAYSLMTFVAGTVTLVLEAGTVDLGSGDCVIMPGIVHGWVVGPSGCAFTVVSLGLGRPGQEEEIRARI